MPSRLIRAPGALTLLLAASCSGSDPEDALTFALDFCPAIEPTWVAQQDGTGAWQQIAPSVEGSMASYRFNFVANRGAIALAYADDLSSTALQVVMATADELPSLAASAVDTGCPDGVVTGRVAGLPTGTMAFVSLGRGSASVSGLAPDFEFQQVPDAPQTLVATRYDPAVSDLSNRIILRRNVQGSTITPDIDFESAEAFAPANGEAAVTTDVPADVIGLSSWFIGDGSVGGDRTIRARTGISGMQDGESTAPYTAVPLGMLQPGEWQELMAEVAAGSSGRGAGLYYRQPGFRSLALGPPLATPAFGVAATEPYLRPSLSLALQPEYEEYLLTRFLQREPGGFRAVEMRVTANYLGTPVSWTVAVPDLSAADGWDNAWGLDPAQDYEWVVRANGGTVLELGHQPADNAVRRWAMEALLAPAARPGVVHDAGRVPRPGVSSSQSLQ